MMEEVSTPLLVSMAVAVVALFLLVMMAYSRSNFQTVTTRRLFQVAPNGTRLGGQYVLQGLTTSGIAKTLSEDGASTFSSGNVPSLPLGTVGCTADVVAESSTTTCQFTAKFTVKRTSGSITVSSPLNISYATGSSTGWTLNITTSSDRQLLYVQAVGTADTRVRWACELKMVYLHAT